MSFNLSSPIRGRVWTFGDSVDTDVISPNQRAPAYEDLKKITMDALRPEFAGAVRPGDIVVGGRNFGCGSHRETANTVLRDLGVQAIIAESIARIFFRVGISLGIPTFEAPGITTIVEDGDEVELDYAGGLVRNLRTEEAVSFAKYPPAIEDIFMAGGIVPLLVQRYQEQPTGRPG